MRLTVVLLLQALVFLNGQFCSGRKDEDGKQLVLEGNPVRKYDDDKGNICYMDGPLRFLNDLKDCKIVVGDIVFARNATGTFDAAALKEVHGCIQIIETQLFSIEWLIGTKIHCKGINKVYSNPLLCANITARANLDMTSREYNIVHEKCPTCLSSDFTKPCPTLFGDIVYNESYYQLLKSVKLLNGRLKFLEGAVIPSDFHFDLEIVNGAHDGPEAAVQLIGCSMPNISDLINLKIKTYATVSIVIRNITGFIYPRHKMLELKSKLDKYGDVEIETEKDGDCYIPYQYEENQPTRTSVEEVLNCVSIYGKIILDANGNSPVANVMSMHSTESIYLTEKRADLGRIFANLRKIELFGKTSFLHIKFDDNVCYKSDIIARIKSALPATDHYKLKVDLTNCNKYKGFVLGKDLIQDDGSRLEHVIGLLYLEPLVMTYPSDYKKWHWDYNRFKNLKTIHKPSYMPADSAALTIEMCGHRVKIPQFITKINVTSERNDDILVRIIGPGYKMERTMFDLILKKYGPTRIDIEPKYPGECNFDSPISDLSKLNGCERIIGDLRMTGKIIGNTTSTIKQITGCIHIVNTTLTNLDFINLEVPYNEKYCQSCWGLDGFAVQHNKNLCANHWMFKVDKEKVAFNKPGCGNEVDEEAYPERNIIFYGSSNNTDFEDYSYIKILKGRIIVANTNIEAFDFFSSLEKIIYIGLGPAVLIHSNSNLSSVTFPKLKEIKVRKGQKAVFMKNNPNLNFNDSQVSQMKKLSNGDIEIDNEQKEIEKKDLMTDGIKLGVGSGIGAVAAILILIILVAVTMILVKKFKKGKKSTRNEKNNLLKNASTKQKKNNRNQHKCGEKIQSKESNHTVASRNSRKTKKSNITAGTLVGCNK